VPVPKPLRRPIPVLLAAALVLGGCLFPPYPPGYPPKPSAHFGRRGFRPLFDGRSLKGWTTTGGRYDGAARWSVEDGFLTGRPGPHGEGGLIYTRRAYTDFDLSLEVRMSTPFDSGIFVRMVPDAKGAQITLDNDEGGEIGGVFSEGWIAHNESGAKKKFTPAEWTRFEISCRGNPMRLAAWMNGEPIADTTLKTSEGFAPSGLIGLQVHGGGNTPEGSRVQFRRILVRERP